jgi:hypothetical protein
MRGGIAWTLAVLALLAARTVEALAGADDTSAHLCNLALAPAAVCSQSTTPDGANCSLALDGDNATAARTAVEARPWYKLDLGVLAFVETLVLEQPATPWPSVRADADPFGVAPLSAAQLGKFRVRLFQAGADGAMGAPSFEIEVHSVILRSISLHVGAVGRCVYAPAWRRCSALFRRSFKVPRAARSRKGAAGPSRQRSLNGRSSVPSLAHPLAPSRAPPPPRPSGLCASTRCAARRSRRSPSRSEPSASTDDQRRRRGRRAARRARPGRARGRRARRRACRPAASSPG